MRKRPNIVYIHSHDTGRYIEPYGYAIPTPNLQAFAEEGVIFRRCYCANPTCSPSRAALVTGTYPHQNGMFGLAHRGWDLNDYDEHVLHTLRAAGHESALSGVQHIVNWDRSGEIGYDEILGGNESADVKAAGWIKDRRDSEQPFFLAVGFGETHREFPKDNWTVNPDHVMPPAPLPDTREMREDMAAYITVAAALDRKMGNVFNALKEAGLWENTLVICTTDHGIAFPRMKCNLTDHGIGVMLMIHGPGGFDGGTAVDGLVSHIDIVPTICDVAGINTPERCEGTSLVPLVTGQSEAVRDEIHAEVNYHACYEPMRCVRTDRYKYIRRFSHRSKPVLPNCDPSTSKTLVMDAGWYDVEQEMLFDTYLDPHETNNVAGKERYAEVLADMRSRLQRWQESTDDPILNGPMRVQPAAMFNDIDGVSAREKQGSIEEFPQF